jgi:hypothetical protein
MAPARLIQFRQIDPRCFGAAGEGEGAGSFIGGGGMGVSAPIIAQMAWNRSAPLA